MFSYIIGYRKNNEREKNLNIVLQYISKFNIDNFEIILVEQDKDSKINFELPKNCKHIFVFNDGNFNRSWGFNVGSKFSKFEKIVFADSDLLIKLEDLKFCLDKLDYFDCINPKGKVLNLDKSEEDFINPKKFVERGGTNFSGGICLFKKEKFNLINCWDEKIEGWGGEDDLMTYKINKMLCEKTISQYNFTIIHLFHEGIKVVPKNEKYYQENLKHLKYIRTLNSEQLFDYYKDKSFGNIEKYLRK